MTTAAELCIRLFDSVDMPLGPGLTGEQLDRIEHDFGFMFDRDQRELLSLATPRGIGWLDWRATPAAQIRAMLAWPTEGVLWDAQHNDYWPRAWGRKPKQADGLDDAVREHLAHVPKLIPIFGHRFMAAGPSLGGAPVFSVYQTDVVYYGQNLPDYVAHELGIPKRYASSVHRKIPFWSGLAENDRRYRGPAPKGGRAFWNRSILGDAPLPHATAGGESITYSIGDAEGIEAANDQETRTGQGPTTIEGESSVGW